MTEQIAINGVWMDTTPGKEASLIFQSPYFTDLDNIVSNRTTSVELPATPNNLRAVDRADLSSGAGQFGSRRHRVDYYLDGILIFTGEAQLLSLTPEALRFSFVWGNIRVFEQLLDAPLRELQDPQRTGDYVTYGPEALFGPYYPEGWNSPENWGGEPGAPVSVQPMMPVSEVMERIRQRFGVTFEFPENISFDDYYIPLLTRCADEKSRQMQGVVLNGVEPAIQQVCVTGDVTRWTTIKIIGGVKHNNSGLFDVRHRIMDVSGIKKLLVRVLAGFAFSSNAYTDFLQVGAAAIADNGDFWFRPLKRIYDERVTHESTGRVGEFLHTYPEDAQVEIDVAAEGIQGVVVYYNSTSAKLWLPGHEGFGPSPSEIPRIMLYDAELEELTFARGMLYPLYTNLPDWSVAQLLKNLMKMEGLFACASDAATIRFVSIGQLYDKRREALDWTDRLMLTDGAPAERSFSFGSFARRNWCRYAEDQTVTRNYDSSFDIDNATLDEQTDLITLDFAPTQDNVIPVWRREGEEWTFEEVEPRILRRERSPHTPGNDSVSFAGLSWPQILYRKYKSYQNLVREVRLLKASVRISALELRDLDLARPVYVRPWGHYYAINKLTVKSGGSADVELLELGAAVCYGLSQELPGEDAGQVEVPDGGYRIGLRANDDGTYCVELPGAAASQTEALIADGDYHLCLVRYGYTRRGKNDRRWDPCVKTLIGTHTDRKEYRKFRGGPMWRIMGHEILRTGHLSPQSQMARSPVYRGATLVFELEETIRLPHVKSDIHSLTRAGRIRNSSCGGIMELYVGLYRRMKDQSGGKADTYRRWGWELVSNLVQVRGRNKTRTRYWDFDPAVEWEV